MKRNGKAPAAALLLAAAAAAAIAGEAPIDAPGGDALAGELRFVATAPGAAARGPLAAAERLRPGIATPAGDAFAAEAELRHTLRLSAGALPLALAGNGLLHAEANEGRASRAEARVNELHLSSDLGAWQASAGRKVLGWDVGYGFRPNDFVQQETRRLLFATTPQGRPLAMVEHFGAEHALSLVWVNPQRWKAAADDARGADESAWALRGYRRLGALDLHGFARHGRRTGASVGAAFAWVATDALELHASWRRLEDHDGWEIAPEAGESPLPVNPWRQGQLGGATQWLVGAQWTGLARQGLLVEYWHDGTALADGGWAAWQARNAALAAAGAAPAPAVPAAAVAGNLAWQATPLNAQSLRRDNLFLRLSWSPERWQWSFDTLFTPEDRGRMHTLALQWQGELWRVDAAWRVVAGPGSAVFASLPTRRSALLAATRAF